MNTNLVDLPVFAGIQVSLPLMRSIVNSAPQNLAQIIESVILRPDGSPEWTAKPDTLWNTVERGEKRVDAHPDNFRPFRPCVAVAVERHAGHARPLAAAAEPACPVAG